jgi:hypothetical protein
MLPCLLYTLCQEKFIPWQISDVSPDFSAFHGSHMQMCNSSSRKTIGYAFKGVRYLFRGTYSAPDFPKFTDHPLFGLPFSHDSRK